MPVASTCSLYAASTAVVQTVDNSKLAVAGTDVAVPIEPFAEFVVAAGTTALLAVPVESFAAGTAALVAVPVESFAAECVAAAVVAETSAPSERVVPRSLFFQKHNPFVGLLLKPEPVPK